MLRQLLVFEWRYHTRQVTFPAASLLFAAIGFALSATGFGPGNVNVNSPQSIGESLGLASLASVFALAVFCASSVTRDRETLMEEIVFSTAVDRFTYLFSRFTGSFLAAFTAFSATVIGMIAGTLLPSHDPARIGTLRPDHYLWILFVLVFPAMLVAGVALFGVAAKTRSMLASVVAAVAIYVLYFVAAAHTNSPLMAASSPTAETSASASLLDPFGVSAFLEQTRYWTPEERNMRVVALSGSFLANRILWLSLAVAGWLFIYLRFPMRVQHERAKRETDEAPNSGERTPYVPVVQSHRNTIRALVAATRIELRSTLASRPFLALTVLWAALCASEMVSEVTGGEFGTSVYPTSGLLLAAVQQPLALVALVVIVYYSAELVWRERAAGIFEIVSATPARSVVFVISKWIALSATSLVMVAIAALISISVQMIRGTSSFDPGVMLAFSWFAMFRLALWSAFAIAVQTLMRRKYPALLLVLAATVLGEAGPSLGVDEPLLRFSAMPPFQYSEMSGFGDLAVRYHWFMALWSVVAALLLLLAVNAWRRDFTTTRRSGTTGRLRSAVASLALLAIALGAFLAWNTRVLNDGSSRAAQLDWKADYERRYRGAGSLPAPAIGGVTFSLDLYPESGGMRLRGHYTLRNRTASPIRRLLVSVSRDAEVSQLSIGSGRLVSSDVRFATSTFELAQPLLPGAESRLDFDLAYTPRGFTHEGNEFVAANGTFLFIHQYLPVIGYSARNEITDAHERSKRGLRANTSRSAETDVALDREWIDLDATISTAQDQTAIAPGQLEKTWIADGRRHFRYRTDRPIPNIVIVASARYRKVVTHASGTPVEIYFHESHGANVEKIAAATKVSLELFSKSFSPYVHRQLRIVESPAQWRFGGFATPGVIFLSESRLFGIDTRRPSPVDLLTRRVAHEVAHQWWGHYVTPLDLPGDTTIVETLAKHSEQIVLRRMHGDGAVAASLEYELDRYLEGRAEARRAEVPLTQTTDEAYLYYGKGGIVMNAVNRLIGEKRLSAALRRFVENTGGPAGRPTVDALVRGIVAETPPADRALVDSWFRQVTTYDVRIAAARVRQLVNGMHEVTLTIRAARAGAGSSPLPLRETFPVELRDEAGKPVVRLQVALRTGVNTVSVVTQAPPHFATVDPDVTRVETNRSDNTAILSAGSRPGT